jgi:hypothetical protein
VRGRFAAGVAIALVIVAVVVGYVTVIQDESVGVRAFVLLVAVAVLVATSVLLVPSRQRANHAVVVVEGQAAPAVNLPDSATGVVISGVTFVLPDDEASGAFEEGSNYRVYYRRAQAGTPVLLSAEHA